VGSENNVWLDRQTDGGWNGGPSQTKAKWNAGMLPTRFPIPYLRNEAVKRSKYNYQFMRIIKVNAWYARNASSPEKGDSAWTASPNNPLFLHPLVVPGIATGHVCRCPKWTFIYLDFSWRQHGRNYVGVWLFGFGILLVLLNQVGWDGVKKYRGEMGWAEWEFASLEI